MLLLLVTASWAQAAAKRVLIYLPTLADTTPEPTQNTSAEVVFINAHSAGTNPEFQPMGPYNTGTSDTHSQIWNEQQWLNASQAKFKLFDVIVISDNGKTLGAEWGAAVASKAIWSSAADGNVFLVAADPIHDSSGGEGLAAAAYVFTQGVRFAAEQPASGHRTGLYVALDHFRFGENLGSVLSPTDIPLLSALSSTGGFTALNSSGHDFNSLRRLVTSHPRLDTLQTVLDAYNLFNRPDINGRNFMYAGFQSWPAGFFPVAYQMDMAPPTPASLFTAPLEADTGYRHPRPLDSQVCILAKTFQSKQLRFLTANQAGLPNQAYAINTPCAFNVTSRFRDYPNGGTGNVPSTTVRWVVESGPNVGQTNTCTGSDGNLTGGYTGGSTTGVDVVRI